MSETPKLTEARERALRWIDENETRRSEWNRTYTHLTISGPTGSVILSAGDAKALVGLICPGEGVDLYAVSPAGRQALEAARSADRGSRRDACL